MQLDEKKTNAKVPSMQAGLNQLSHGYLYRLDATARIERIILVCNPADAKYGIPWLQWGSKHRPVIYRAASPSNYQFMTDLIRSNHGTQLCEFLGASAADNKSNTATIDNDKYIRLNPLKSNKAVTDANGNYNGPPYFGSESRVDTDEEIFVGRWDALWDRALHSVQ